MFQVSWNHQLEKKRCLGTFQMGWNHQLEKKRCLGTIEEDFQFDYYFSDGLFRDTSQKQKWQKRPFEDVSPIKDGDLPLSC